MSFRSGSSDIGDKHQEAIVFFEFLIDIERKKEKYYYQMQLRLMSNDKGFIRTKYYQYIYIYIKTIVLPKPVSRRIPKPIPFVCHYALCYCDHISYNSDFMLVD